MSFTNKRSAGLARGGQAKGNDEFGKSSFVKSNRAAAKALTLEFEKRAEEAKSASKLEALATDAGHDDGTTSLHLERIFAILQDHHMNNPSDPFITTDDLVERARLEPKLIYPKLKRSLQDPNSRYRFTSKNGVVSYAIKLRHYAHNAETLLANMRACYTRHGYKGETYKNNLQLCYKDVHKDLKKLHCEKKLIVIDLQEKSKPVHDQLVFYRLPQFSDTVISDEAKSYWERAKSDGQQKRLEFLRKYNKPAIRTFRPFVKEVETVKQKKRAAKSSVALSNSHLKNFPGNL